MGFRTVLALSNDLAQEWENDPKLGRKIWEASCRWNRKGDQSGYEFHYGQIIEQVHADCQTLIIAEHYGGKPVAHWSWHAGQTEEDRNLRLLKELADKLGYRVSKKPVQTAHEAGL